MSAQDTTIGRQKNAHEFFQLGSASSAAIAALVLGLLLLTIIFRGGAQEQAEAPVTAEQVQAVIQSAAD